VAVLVRSNDVSSAARRIFVARAIRDFGDGLAAVVVPAYLASLGLTAAQVGVVATSALLGSAALTFAIGFHAAGRDLRALLLGAAALMAATGVGYAAAGAYWLLVAIACVGTINPSAGSTSVFVPLEHAVLSSAAPPSARTATFARYSLIGSLASAAGALAAAVPGWLASFGGGTASYRVVFVVYGALGVCAACAYLALPRQRRALRSSPAAALGPSRRAVFKLAALFSLDAFAGGFVVQSLLALWLFERFDLSLTAAGVFFFWTGTLAALSFPVAARLAARIGLVNTMVFTHIPASLCLIAAAFAPSLAWVIALLSCRAVLGQMDVPVRSSYVMSVVTEAERPAAASATAVPRSLASALSPALAGALFSAGLAWPLLICGGLKIVYDLLLLATARDGGSAANAGAHLRPTARDGGSAANAGAHLRPTARDGASAGLRNRSACGACEDS
jgi:MFS family permease